MFYCIQLILILTVTLSFGCKDQAEIQSLTKNPQANSYDNREVDVLIDQLSDRREKVRQQAISSIIGIANTSKSSREKVLVRLIDRFDIFRRDKKQIIRSEETEELLSYLKLFLDLDAVEALDVMIKYIDSYESISSMGTLISKTVEKFGEDAIPGLIKGLSNPDEEIRRRSAVTLSQLKFRRNKELGMNQAIEVLEKAKETERSKEVTGIINQAIMTLNQRKLPNYPIEDY